MNIISRIAPAIPTPVFDAYWKFAAERQRVFFSRIRRSPPPWTDDLILQTYKFTNSYRASDRVSQFLIKEVIYGQPSHPADQFFRILLFKTFNKIETWELLERELGILNVEDFSIERYDTVLSSALSRGERIYSGAYIMASGRSYFGFERKHQNHLRLLDMLNRDGVFERVADCSSMSRVFDLLAGYPTFGSFLAYQYAIDINYSELVDFSENDFVMPGPGAVDGISKCFSSRGGLTEADMISYCVDIQGDEFERLGIEFDSLWGRPLHLIDCQNLFCEISKYSRVAFPEITGISGRTRIKARFKAGGEIHLPFYPPKWGVNNRIEKELSNDI
jgi:hypothetical protein